jgi:hypothetical protein
MIKISFLTISLIFTLISSNAQHFGIKVGVNSSNISETGFSTQSNLKFFGDTKQLIGLNAGLFAQLGKNKLHLQPELLFSMKGFNIPSEKYRVTYITVPILIGYSFTPKLALQLGPEVGLMLNKENTVILGRDEVLKSFDYSIVIGGNFKFNERMGLSLRYNYGLADIIDLYYRPTLKMSNRNLQASLQYSLK